MSKPNLLAKLRQLVAASPTKPPHGAPKPPPTISDIHGRILRGRELREYWQAGTGQPRPK